MRKRTMGSIRRQQYKADRNEAFLKAAEKSFCKFMHDMFTNILARNILQKRGVEMSNFVCSACGALIIDSPTGYVTGCEHYPFEDVDDCPDVRGYPEYEEIISVIDTSKSS